MTWEPEFEDEFPEEEWVLGEKLRDLYKRTLSELVKEGYPEGDTTRIGVRTLPTGLLSWWRELVDRENKISLSKIQKTTISHGLSILYHDVKVRAIMGAYKEKRKKAKIDGDKILMKTLEEKGSSINFIFSTTYHTTVEVLIRAEGPLAGLSAALGVPLAKLVPYLAIISLDTLQDVRWTNIVKEELDLFWRFIDERLKALRG